MSFQQVIGQEKAKQVLQNGLRKHRISHAYIFHGPSGTGKKQMAYALAKAIFCLKLEDDACGECVECRKIEHGNHPNLHWIEPDGQSIKIDQIRELQKEFAYRAALSQTKIYIIGQADRMTVQAANSLLKFLEEPQSNVVAILITENGQALLPTIRSRAQWVPFTPMIPKEMASILLQEGLPAALVQPGVHLASGLAGAREIIQWNKFAEMLTVMIQLAKESLLQNHSALLSAHQLIIKTELVNHIETLLSLFILWFKDMVHVHWNRKEQLVFIDQADWISAHAFDHEVSFWVACMEQALELKKRLRFHVNPQLALEQFIISIGRR